MKPFFFLLIFGVNSKILSKKYSNTYFLIYLSFIVEEIDLNFFSNIALDDGLSSICLE